MTNTGSINIIRLRIVPILVWGAIEITKQKQIILDIIMADRTHPTADEIYLKAKQRLPSIAVGTVYRNLNIMCDAGEIRRIPVPDGADRYDRSVVPHDHILCKKCGRMVDIKIDGLAQFIEKQAEISVGSYELHIQGICKECNKN